jgi:hypothetical protein
MGFRLRADSSSAFAIGRFDTLANTNGRSPDTLHAPVSFLARRLRVPVLNWTRVRVAVSAENIELAFVCQGSGSARKKFEMIFLSLRLSPTLSHSRNNGRSVSLTCLLSACLAQSNTMLVSFFA